jgi:hypothetical protein
MVDRLAAREHDNHGQSRPSEYVRFRQSVGGQVDREALGKGTGKRNPIGPRVVMRIGEASFARVGID